MKSLLSLIISLLIVSQAIAQTGDFVFKNEGLRIESHISHYDTSNFNSVIQRKTLPSDVDHFEFQNSEWEISKHIEKVKDKTDAYDITFIFRCVSGSSPATSVSVDFIFDNWSVTNYVLMPAAVYNGNRVKSVRHPYCPFLFDSRDIGPDKPQVISDVPRLNIENGPSRIQQRSGDMSTPAVGFHNPSGKRGFWLLTTQNTVWGDNGLDLEENNTRTKAVISLTAPVVRERYQYFIADMQHPSTDQPANFKAGDSVKLFARIYLFSSPDVQSLYNKFIDLQNDVLPKGNAPDVLPFSAAFKIQEEKFNRQNFEATFGYYSVGLRENCYQDWQIGWTGGMITTYPLFVAGGTQAQNNVIRNFNWLFPAGISPSGYFWDTGEKGTNWFGIFPTIPMAKDLHLVRKSADGLYYIFRQFNYFKKQNVTINPVWEQGTKTVTDAFVKTWKTYHQLGQYVNNITGELAVGGSTSGAIAPAALLLASEYFNNPEYKTIAEEIAISYYENYVRKGLIYGGPGDAMQNFDSESAYAMLESFSVLYEHTAEVKWLKMAEDMAAQFATWVHSYDYVFPKTSTLGKLNKKTTGVVWANTQNKHGAPGICTHSGVALLRLYRATGNIFYLNLLRDIAKAIPQYMSLNENPIPGIQQGWISERVSTTDWLEGIGEIMNGSTWAETALLLTIVELPGIYVDLKNGVVCDFDQVEISEVKIKKNQMEIMVRNPTKYEANISIYADRDKSKRYSPFEADQKVRIEAGGVKIVVVKK